MRALATAFVAVFLCLQPASAQVCTPPGVVAAQATASVPHARILEILSGGAAAQMVHAYNQLEPISEHVADFVAVFVADGVPFVLLIAYSDNCVVFVDQIPAALFMAIKGQGA